MCVLTKLFFKIAFLVMILECYMVLKLVLEKMEQKGWVAWEL